MPGSTLTVRLAEGRIGDWERIAAALFDLLQAMRSPEGGAATP